MVESSPHSPRPPRFEARDISVRAVVWFTIGLIVSAIVIHITLGWLYVVFEHRFPSPDSPSRIAFGAKMIAPEPRLQINPPADLERFQKEEETKLDSYGWVNAQAGVIRIPIQRAMELIAQRGLPVRGPGTQNSSGKTPIDMQREKAASPPMTNQSSRLEGGVPAMPGGTAPSATISSPGVAGAPPSTRKGPSQISLKTK